MPVSPVTILDAITSVPKRVTFSTHLDINAPQQLEPYVKTSHQIPFSGPSIVSCPFPGPFSCPFTRPPAVSSPFPGPSHNIQWSQYYLTKTCIPSFIWHHRKHPRNLDHMPRSIYTPDQHAHRKVPIECREQIEKALQNMVDQGIITPVTEPTEWVSSLTYPCKPDGTICPFLYPQNLNKAIIREHYKAPP